MNYLRLFLPTLFFSALTLADDTEIYGTEGVTEANRLNPNVLLIVDTSGSMQGSVSYEVKQAYDAGRTYPQSYAYNSYFYPNPNYNAGWGNSINTLNSSCNAAKTSLSNTGLATTNLQQYNNNVWGSLVSGSGGTIRCFAAGSDQGFEYNLYSGNYSNWFQGNDSVEQIGTRMDVVQEVVTNLANSLEDINLGLMRFNSGNGGKVDVSVADIASSKTPIKNKVNSYYPGGGTPLTESLHEAALYFRGENKKYGGNGTYTSPIKGECQKNHVILFTDGEPSSDTGSVTSVRNYIKDMDIPDDIGLSKSCTGDGGCLDELSYWMKNTEISFGDEGKTSPGIVTHTIGGFNLSAAKSLLTNTANRGGGGFYEADDASTLSEVLTTIFTEILATDTTFTAPAVSVNAFNASQHNDEVFYALFRPEDKIKWGGNLKRYRLSDSGELLDFNNTAAIDSETGYFDEGSYGFWNDKITPDGKNVTYGGMANLITTPASRLLFSNSSNTAMGNFSSVASYDSFDMSEDVDVDFDETDIFKWVQGYDMLDINGNLTTTDSRKQIGDPMHSEPVIVTYRNIGTADAPISDATIFFGTNEGFIHAVDTATGTEQFAFLPKELHPLQKSYFDNTQGSINKPYGMDGPISTWFYDKNGNSALLNSSGSLEADEHAYLYAGMRRGGNNYYALDVSNKTTPTMKFVIEGGTGNFARLGQTWSKMVIAKVKLNGDPRFVAFFSGGYDENQDISGGVSTADSIGNAIYMVDASTGERLWWASDTGADLNISTMVNSMPASISAVDISGDGFINYLFASDTGGRVFRIDINQSNTGQASFATGGAIASLAGTDADNNRRFYNKPNVSLVKDDQAGDYLTIAIGSGYRAHPIVEKNVDNRFYVIKDSNPYKAPTSYSIKTEELPTKITLGENETPDPLKLYNATALMKGGKAALNSDMYSIMSHGGGWYVQMETEGEKVLAQSTTFSGAIIFTSFSPSSDSNSGVCGADTGQSRVYALSQKWAIAAVDLNEDGIIDSSDASTTLVHSGIAPRPVVIYRENGGKTIAIGTQTIDDTRFNEEVSDPDCAINGTCEEEVTKCEEQNCYVVPVYWRQN